MGFYRYLLVIWSVVWTLTVVNASENIASGKVTNQKSVLKNWDSSKAVDGCTTTEMNSGCCTHTAEGQNEAWWQVDLQKQSVIDTVTITYRDQNTLNRLAGYEIYLSNTQDWTSGNRCHKDFTADLASMSAIQNVQCPGVAQYLTIYNDRRVKAKPWYSNDSILELCEVQVSGCPVGRYGNGNCNNDCLNCLGNMCDTTSGTCDDCAAGYYEVGFCIPCSSNCAGKKCDSLTGACLDGCTTGFSGTWCRCPVNCKDTNCPNEQCTDCNNGYYGPACTPCPVGCITDTCDKMSGHCFHCSDGFYGPTCIRCPIGCSADTCNTTSGHCFKCDSGFHGSLCNQSCPGNCSNVCNMDNGQCTECIIGSHGSFCNQSCSGNCKNSVCDKSNGRCTECDDGSYGSFCNQSCPVNCKNNVCNMVNGQCTVVSLPCKEDDFKAAAVGIGSGFGVVIVALVIVIIVQARRLRSMINQSTRRATTMKDISLPSIGQERRTETEGTYAVIGAPETEESITKMSAGDSSYEQLGYRERDVPHLYETT